MTKLYIYNTLSKKKEEFQPFYDENKKDFVGIYTCGPTVYSDPHIGNLRSYVFANLLRNIIKNFLGYPVKHVVNITDVGHLTDDMDEGEDKLEKASKKEKLSAWDIAEKYEKNFENYLEQLNIQPFDVMPKATQHIQEQIEFIQSLEEKGYTYITDDGVYMDTSKVENYGKLIGKEHIQGLEEGARISSHGKKNATDFALWKFSPENEKRQMEWESPWGKGFPGWHIECSAMSRKYLGDNFDIHTGGIDHIPVHHTNEIAQSECLIDDKKWVKYWMHIQFLTFKGEKASKSTGNVFNFPDILENGYSALDLRFFYLTAHYRSFLNFTLDELDSKSKSYQNIIKSLSEVCSDLDLDLENLDINSYSKTEFSKNIINYLLDDINTPKVLAEIHKFIDEINSFSKNEKINNLKSLFFIDEKVLKLNLIEKVKEEIQKQLNIPQEVIDLAQKRQEARKNKDFENADKIRDELHQKGYIVKDTPEGFEIEAL